MRNLKNVAYLLLALLSLSLGTAGCSGSREIDKMKKDLLNSPVHKGKERCWATNYSYWLTDDVKLQCKEIMWLYKDGTFKEKREFYYEGKLMATVSRSGKWDISYIGDDSYYFDQEYSDGLKIENVNFADEWFTKFDTDIRMNVKGDFSESDDEDSSYGLGIIDCTPEVFIIQDVSDEEVYRYEPYTVYL
ncbi:MAG: hypothetical protein K2I18_07340 [Paramuribaculum sp.]|nr:hypothetical protein [Paramuribaculum sp.]